jgi:hypothetical protein
MTNITGEKQTSLTMAAQATHLRWLPSAQAEPEKRSELAQDKIFEGGN